jgi:hypothetical protein
VLERRYEHCDKALELVKFRKEEFRGKRVPHSLAIFRITIFGMELQEEIRVI